MKINPVIKHIALGIGGGVLIYLVIHKHCTPDAAASSATGGEDLLSGGGGGVFGGGGATEDDTSGDTGTTDGTTDTTDTGTTDTGTDTGTTTTPPPSGGGTTVVVTPPPSGGGTTTTPPPPPAQIAVSAADFRVSWGHDGKSDIKYTVQYVGTTPLIGTATVNIVSHFDWHSGVLGKTNPHTDSLSLQVTSASPSVTKKVVYNHQVSMGTVQLSVSSVSGTKQNPAASGSSRPTANGADGLDLHQLDDDTRNYLLGFGKRNRNG